MTEYPKCQRCGETLYQGHICAGWPDRFTASTPPSSAPETTPKCNCYKYLYQVCDICQGVASHSPGTPAPAETRELLRDVALLFDQWRADGRPFDDYAAQLRERIARWNIAAEVTENTADVTQRNIPPVAPTGIAADPDELTLKRVEPGWFERFQAEGKKLFAGVTDEQLLAADPDATATEPGTLFETVRLGLCLGASGKERDDAIRALYSIAGRSFEDATPRALKAVGLCSRCGHGRSTCGVGLGEYTGEVQPATSPSIAATPDAPSDPTPEPIGMDDPDGILLGAYHTAVIDAWLTGSIQTRNHRNALFSQIVGRMRRSVSPTDETTPPNTPTPDTQ